MMKSPAIFITTTAITTTVALAMTRQYDVRWSTTLGRYEVDLPELRYTETAGSDVTTANDVTVRARTVNRTPHPYDPMLGWYTAAVISGLILAFVFYTGMKKAKHATIDCWEARRAEKWLRSRRLSSSEMTVFVVAEGTSTSTTPHDNDNTATTKAFAGDSATLRTVGELTTTCDRGRQASDTTNNSTTAMTIDDDDRPVLQPTITMMCPTTRPSEVSVPLAASVN